jgi:hypothetical protein
MSLYEWKRSQLTKFDAMATAAICLAMMMALHISNNKL